MNTNIHTLSIQNRSAAGFSLIEMAIVLIVIALLAGGMMLSLGTQQDIQRTNEVRRQLADIREALLGYAIANGRLPPPADPTKANSDPMAGLIDEGRVSGVVPWVALGLPETDPWGQRFTYRVRAEFADAIALNTTPPCVLAPGPTQSSFALCSLGNISVTDGTVNIATVLPAIVVSHGKNGLGGYRTDGSQIAGSVGDELENANNDTSFVSRTHNATFDDELTWIPLFNLLSRMVVAGRLP
ncbi:prepilin-type N-terminal cleavage/methylation domain-containing protein [uncultured Dechloromonas sp.]|uniref:type II secretion system protein n=1 Tax=uncultured Dechloromonas sp. TaxID=171719 RepID=UPI0025D963F0|nr:prepilin-type N-terminal cleavage/methylation domain-containing protein [uncultured Dechloromonas sp.]